MKILAIDIGNTRTRMATVEDRKAEGVVWFPTGEVEQVTEAFKTFYGAVAPEGKVPVVICSVVPKLTEHLERAAELTMDTEPLVIGRNLPLPLTLDLKDTQRVGPDRVVSAAMAFERMEKAVAVASFGTAITIDCVNDEGVFLGGVILPGLRISAKALEEYTAMLPLVDLEPPETPWGRDTAEAISGGVVFGAVGALREVVERFATSLGRWPELIVTGGDGELIAKHCEFIHAVVPDLLLMGMELTYEHGRRHQRAR